MDYLLRLMHDYITMHEYDMKRKTERKILDMNTIEIVISKMHLGNAILGEIRQVDGALSRSDVVLWTMLLRHHLAIF